MQQKGPKDVHQILLLELMHLTSLCGSASAETSGLEDLEVRLAWGQIDWHRYHARRVRSRSISTDLPTDSGTPKGRTRYVMGSVFVSNRCQSLKKFKLSNAGFRGFAGPEFHARRLRADLNRQRTKERSVLYEGCRLPLWPRCRA